MAKSLDQIFEECLERVFRGESIESCLMSYPNEAASLEPLLRTALGFTNRAATLQPDPEFKARARMRLHGAMYAAAQPMPKERHGGFAWQRSWAFALSAVVLLLFGSAGTAFASANAMPDEPLYGAKLATEQVQLAFTFSEENKAALHASFAEQRAQEIAAMAEEGKTDYVVATAAKLNYQMEQAESALNRLELKEMAKPVSIAVSLQPSPQAIEPTISEPAPALAPAPTKITDESALGASANETLPELSADTEKTDGKKVKRAWDNFNQSTSKNIEVLEGVLDKSPDQAKPALKRVINKTKEIRERTLKHRIDTRHEPQSHEPEQGTTGISADKPGPQSNPSTWKDDEARPVEPGDTGQPADIQIQTSTTTQPADNNTQLNNISVPRVPSPSLDTLIKTDNTSSESDTTKSTSILPVPKHKGSGNFR